MNKDYREKIRKSGKWREANDYEVFNFASCLECRHYQMDKNLLIAGDCKLMEADGAFNGVMGLAVCSKFLSNHGKDINGKKVPPSLFPSWVKVEKLGKMLYLKRDFA